MTIIKILILLQKFKTQINQFNLINQDFYLKMKSFLFFFFILKEKS